MSLSVISFRRVMPGQGIAGNLGIVRTLRSATLTATLLGGITAKLIGALLIAAIMLSGAAIADAPLHVTVGNPGLEHFDSEGAVQLDFGMTDQSGAPVGNLRPDNVEVFENGKQAKIIDFRGVGQGRPVDIVFVLDITESMQPYIDAVKQNIINFVNDLAANNRDYRLGLVTFEDYVVSAAADCNCEYHNQMTSNVNQFIGWVGSLHAGGGGDIPEDQLDALDYAAKFPFRPQAQGIVIIVTDAPPHHDGDGSENTQHDQAFWDHHQRGVEVTNLTGAKVAATMQRNGLTLYAVAPPPFIAPEYAEVVDATHGRLFNIVSEEDRFPELVREIGHSIATEYSLSYRTPQPIEDGTKRDIQLRVNYNGESGVADTSYQVRGVGGAAIHVPNEGSPSEEGNGLTQVSFAWWNGAVPLLALMGLFGLSRVRFGVPADELKSIVEAQSRTPAPNLMASARDYVNQRQQRNAVPPARAPAPTQASPRTSSGLPSPMVGGTREARLSTLNPTEPVPGEYALLKDEVSLGRGEDNDIVIPHASVSRVHARLARRNGAFELTDLNSTNGSYVNGSPVNGTVPVSNGSEVRFGDIRFMLRF
ncbi:MAG TPA: FHA domain-containing protein [Candidatus Binataceae bacterium]|nr:FHA domain-containing protein [Candidatus Binataceae bacterium]